MRDYFVRLFARARGAFKQRRTYERVKRLSLAAACCLGRHTLTQIICTCGRQFQDWSADYRVFERKRFAPEKLFAVARREVLAALPEKSPVVALMDDTLRQKRGKKIEGTSWRRDPLGPQFRPNFIWAQRFLQVSLALPEKPGAPTSPARAIPVDFHHAPSPRKPGKKASKEERERYREASAAMAISRIGAQRITALRKALDGDPGGRQRQLIQCVDGSFTNRAVLKNLPQRTTLIGRIRKDAALYALPEEAPGGGRGRKRCYGEKLQTPEEMRQDPSIPWQSVPGFAAGKEHHFDVKIIGPLRWKAAGGKADLALMIVRPLAYKLTKAGPRNYRQPAYFISTDPSLPPQQMLQSYLWRWEIENNFRDEKTLLGVGQAQVRKKEAIETLAAFLVASYSLLLLALHKTGLKETPIAKPLWQRQKKERHQRITTGQAVNILRQEIWIQENEPNKTPLIAPHSLASSGSKKQKPFELAAFYASG